MDFDKYVDLELGLQLKEKGFDEMCGYTFVNHRRVKDEIKESKCCNKSCLLRIINPPIQLCNV